MPHALGGQTPAWHAVVLNWNGRDETLACLASLAQVSYPKLRVLCVDNGSQDGSQQAIRERFPNVELLETGSNLGYSAGNNLGLRHALAQGAERLVLVNNDVTVASDVIEGFERAWRQQPQAGILAGKLYFAEQPRMIWFAGQRVNQVLGYSGRPRGYRRSDGPRYACIRATGRAAGALMAISRGAIEAVGLLDEQLFVYVEDVDWSLRVRDAGFEVVFAPDARAWHRVSAATGGESSPQSLYYGTRNTIVVLERHRPVGRLATRLRRAAIVGAFVTHALAREDRGEALAAVRAGLADARAGRLGRRDVMPSRRGTPR